MLSDNFEIFYVGRAKIGIINMFVNYIFVVFGLKCPICVLKSLYC